MSMHDLRYFVSRGMTALAVFIGFALFPTHAVAFPTFLDAFTARYPSATKLDSCGVCHQNFTNPGARNPYGLAWADAGGTSNPAAAFAALEGPQDDEDGDGTSNLAEIMTGSGFMPGWSCDTYTTASNAPSDLADFVDPANVGCNAVTSTTMAPTTTSSTTTLPAPTTTSSSTTLPAPTTTSSTTTSMGVTTTSSTSTSSTLGATTTTTVVVSGCSQPVSSGSMPTASDCLFILKVAVGTETCDPACLCAPKGSLPVSATDALVCLRKAVGQQVSLACPC